MKSTAIILGLLALIAGGASQVAVAAGMPGPSASVTVSTDDLDLGSAAGRASLDRRLALAAAEVCGDPSASDPAGRRAIRACRATVVRQAHAEVAARLAVGRLAAR